MTTEHGPTFPEQNEPNKSIWNCLENCQKALQTCPPNGITKFWSLAALKRPVRFGRNCTWGTYFLMANTMPFTASTYSQPFGTGVATAKKNWAKNKSRFQRHTTKKLNLTDRNKQRHRNWRGQNIQEWRRLDFFENRFTAKKLCQKRKPHKNSTEIKAPDGWHRPVFKAYKDNEKNFFHPMNIANPQTDHTTA